MKDIADNAELFKDKPGNKRINAMIKSFAQGKTKDQVDFADVDVQQHEKRSTDTGIIEPKINYLEDE